MDLLEAIERAFEKRQRPASIIDALHASPESTKDAMAFEGVEWRQVTCAMLEKYFDAVIGFTPSAFCYFLPGIFSAGIRENRPDLLVNDTLISTLDRGNSAASWDSFFAARWPMLSPEECEAAQRWVLWLEEAVPAVIDEISLTRAFDTLDLLSKQNLATPIAKYFPG
jgi:hypothetical protein